MIRHIALFKFKSAVSAEKREELIQHIRRLPEQVPGVKDFEVHRDLLGTPQSYDLGLMASFDDLNLLLRYGDHPQRVATGKMAQDCCESIIIFDYEPDTASEPRA